MKFREITLPDKGAERLKRAQLVKTMRKLMGLKAQDIAKELNVLQSNYSKMERGLETLSDYRFDVIKGMFRLWQEQEVIRLKNQIDYLNNFID